MSGEERARFSIRLADLERATRIPPDQLVEERPEQDLPHELRGLAPELRWAPIL